MTASRTKTQDARAAYVIRLLTRFHDDMCSSNERRQRDLEDGIAYVLADLLWDQDPDDPVWDVVEGSLASRRHVWLRIHRRVLDIRADVTEVNPS